MHRHKKANYFGKQSNILRAQWLSDLGFQTSVGDVKRQICCPLCLIKFETMAEKADATGRFS